MAQRRKFSANGEIRSWTRRPTMALPAHSRGGSVRMAAVDSFSGGLVWLIGPPL